MADDHPCPPLTLVTARPSSLNSTSSSGVLLPERIEQDQLDQWLSTPPMVPSSSVAADSAMDELCADVTTELVGPEFSPVASSPTHAATPPCTTTASLASSSNQLHRPVSSRVRLHLKSLPAWYRANTSPKEMAFHIRVLLQARKDNRVVVRSYWGGGGSSGSVEDRVVVVCAKDRRQLLDAITRSLSSRASIKEATIVTTGDGFALDRFVLQPPHQHHQPPDDAWEGDLKHDIEAMLDSLPPVLPSPSALPTISSSSSSPASHSIAPLCRTVQLPAAPRLPADVDAVVRRINFQQIRLMRALGEGRSGKTYVAQYNGQLVAAKVIATTTTTITSTSPDNDAMAQFQRELSMVSQLDHANIVRFLGASSRPPKYVLLFELCQGDLWTVLHPPRSSSAAARFSVVQFMLDIARGLAYLHSQSVLHRDVKPENLMVDSTGTAVKVADFGLSCRFAPKPVRELSAETGTYRYMAPEVLRHDSYSWPVDVYSFGMVCYVLVTRKAPFEQWTPLQTAMAVSRQHARPKLPSALPKPLEQLITQCWHPNAALRPSFEHVLSSLEAFRLSLSASRRQQVDKWDYGYAHLHHHHHHAQVMDHTASTTSSSSHTNRRLLSPV